MLLRVLMSINNYYITVILGIFVNYSSMKVSGIITLSSSNNVLENLGYI